MQLRSSQLSRDCNMREYRRSYVRLLLFMITVKNQKQLGVHSWVSLKLLIKDFQRQLICVLFSSVIES